MANPDSWLTLGSLAAAAAVVEEEAFPPPPPPRTVELPPRAPTSVLETGTAALPTVEPTTLRTGRAASYAARLRMSQQRRLPEVGLILMWRHVDRGPLVLEAMAHVVGLLGSLVTGFVPGHFFFTLFFFFF